MIRSAGSNFRNRPFAKKCVPIHKNRVLFFRKICASVSESKITGRAEPGERPGIRRTQPSVGDRPVRGQFAKPIRKGGFRSSVIRSRPRTAWQRAITWRRIFTIRGCFVKFVLQRRGLSAFRGVRHRKGTGRRRRRPRCLCRSGNAPTAPHGPFCGSSSERRPR